MCFFSGRTNKKVGVKPLEKLEKSVFYYQRENGRKISEKKYESVRSKGGGFLDTRGSSTIHSPFVCLPFNMDKLEKSN